MHSVEETQQLSRALVAYLVARPETPGTATIVALKGDLGAGKTAFVKGVAHAFALPDTVTSPTFVIEKIYYLEEQAFSLLIHIDAYRLESDDELRAIGWHETVTDPHNIVFIEWPERVAASIPRRALWLSFEVLNETTRRITFEGFDEAAFKAVEAV